MCVVAEGIVEVHRPPTAAGTQPIVVIVYNYFSYASVAGLVPAGIALREVLVQRLLAAAAALPSVFCFYRIVSSHRVVDVAGVALLFERVPPTARVPPITFFLRRYR